MTGETFALAFVLTKKDLDRVEDKLSWQQYSRVCRKHSPAAFVWICCDRVIGKICEPLIRLVAPSSLDPGPSEPESVRWGATELIATSEDLTVRLAFRTTVYRWAAIRELRQSRRTILLMITSVHAVLVPRSAFARKSDEVCFCNFVRDRIAAATNPAA